MPSAHQENNHVNLPEPADLSKLLPVITYPIEELHNERTKTLKQLLNDGHAETAILREPALKFHTHLPHHLGSAYRLGASSKQLHEAYSAEANELLAHDHQLFYRNDNISRENWTEFIQQKPQAVAYVDFFDREVQESSGRWKEVVQRYLYDTKIPLINGLTGGLGHPFIHLAYAYVESDRRKHSPIQHQVLCCTLDHIELDYAFENPANFSCHQYRYEFQSAAVATEALGLACTELDSFYTDLINAPPDNSKYKTNSLGDIVSAIHRDSRFDGLLHQPGFENTFQLMYSQRDLMLEHWNAWEITDPLQQLEHICDLSVLLAIGTGDAEKQYDFFLAHLMTVAHALRVLWHEFPAERRMTILKEYAMFVMYIYAAQLRRPFDMTSITDFELEGRDWQWVATTALAHEAALDAHFFKVVCAPQAFEGAFGKKQDFYLKAAIKFIVEFNGWTGFGAGTDGFDPSEA